MSRSRGNGTLTLELLRSCLHYDPATGIFIWLIDGRSQTPKGSVAGADTGHGYRKIGVAGRRYYAHRLAWFYVYGVWPPDDTDHINGNPSDNRIANLRLATRSQNNWNTSSRRSTKPLSSVFKGVCAHKKSKKNPWHAQITVHDKNINLGYHPTEESARDAYMAAVTKYYGEYGRIADAQEARINRSGETGKSPEMEAFLKGRKAKAAGDDAGEARA